MSYVFYIGDKVIVWMVHSEDDNEILHGRFNNDIFAHSLHIVTEFWKLES